MCVSTKCYHILSPVLRRLTGLLKASKGQVVIGGETDASERYIAPTIITHVAADDKLMEEEVFGPLLPIVTVHSVDEAIQFANKM